MTEPSLLIDPKTASLFTSVTEAIVKTLKNPARDLAIEALGRLQGYGPYLEETNARVSTFKSFANPSRPVLLLDHFTTMSLSQRDNKVTIDQDEIIARMERATRTVVSATAGHGKSMLMRFVALCMYNNPKGRIPIFVELRHLNRMQSSDLMTYIHSSYNRLSLVERKSFDQNLKSGVFAFIFDGFDELSHEIRRDIEDQILLLSREHPKNSMIVSGRPDERFESWRDFEIFKIEPMTQSQVVELLNKLDFDRGTRKRFISKIETDNLYDTHESFLSTPLLAILMLLTFEENANIPDKMHLFYSKAFETLFHKHDALKEQYDRERKSGILIDDFSRVFSVFCLNTYIREKIEFNQVELLQYIRDAISYHKSKVSPDDLLFDLVEAVCLLQKEGLSYFFVHRSFQEYFTAMFLASCPEDVRDAFIDQVCTRHWDNVLPMLYDMAAPQIEPSWVVRKIDHYLNKVGAGSKLVSPVLARYPQLIFHTSNDRSVLMRIGKAEFFTFFATMNRFYPEDLSFSKSPINFGVIEDTASSLPGFREAEQEASVETNVFGKDKGKIVTVQINEDSMRWLTDTGLKRHADEQHRAIVRIRKRLESDLEQKNEFLSRLFSPGN